MDERQKTLEQLAGKLLADWRGAIGGLMNDQPAERPAPDFAAQEEKLAQLTAEQKTAYEKASQLRAALDTQAAKLEEATAQSALPKPSSNASVAGRSNLNSASKRRNS